MKLAKPLKKPDRIMLIGVPGIGKTTFGASAPNPVFLDLEDGTSRLNLEYVLEKPSTLTEVYAHLQSLATEQHDRKTLVVDTLDALDALIVAHVCTTNKWGSVEAPGYGKGYVAVNEEWRRVLAALDRVREKGLELILISHSQIKNFANPSGPDYSRYEPKLTRGCSEIVMAWCDTVLFAIHEESVSKEGKGKVTVSGRRVIKTQRGNGWEAKNRDGLPAEIDLDYGQFDLLRHHDLAALQAQAVELAKGNAKAEAFVKANWCNSSMLSSAINRLKELAHA